MGREIKFRAKDKDTNEWLAGNLLQDDYGNCCLVGFIDHHETWYDVISETVGQFTGVYDENGNEIYEGDIVDTYPFDRGHGVFVVRFASGYEECLGMHNGWYLEQGNFERYMPLKTSNEETEKYEVIGNIYDNKDLIKWIEK